MSEVAQLPQVIAPVAVTKNEVRIVGKVSELNKLLKKPSTLTIVDFFATWCPPCRAIEPIFKGLAESLPEIQFVKVNVDKAQALSSNYGVTAMPTFVFIKDGEKLDTMVGADPKKLFELVQKYGS